jgi:hypothetical protein
VCETWSVTLREEHIPRVFGNRVLRKMFGPKMEETTGEQAARENEIVDLCFALDSAFGGRGEMRWA